MKRTALACILMAFSTVCAAETLPVTANAVFSVNGQEFTISRVSTLEQTTISALIQLSPTCVAPCLSPMTAAPNIPTLGELDMIEFLSTQVDSGPATQDAAVLIVDLLAARYSSEKIGYYGGGIQVWTTLGLSSTAATR
ncbi:hypothetical protein [Octadecabacter arcticus]|uniref:hypothetical protein n=1 Tax=Octadecabacter arcticus TaxID=53946 RepID=UPI0002E2190E|nr:hypothetical protein [Octadecabacter arcticus]